MSDDSIYRLTGEFTGKIQSDFSDAGYREMDRAGDSLIELIRTVVRDELRKATEAAELAQTQATQAMWDSDEFKAQVDELKSGISDNHRCPECNRIERFGHGVLCSYNV